jgi:hypothetical protein
MPITPEARERAMRVHEVILRGLSKAWTWLQVADILGRSPRSIRRLRRRFGHHGYEGLYDGRRVKPSPRRAPVAEVERILRLYRERYPGFNGRHFYQIARREHAVSLSYTFVKRAAPARGAAPPAPGAGAASTAAGAPAVFRRAGAPRRQPPRLAGPGPRPAAHAAHGGRRRDHTAALRAARGWRGIGRCHHDGPPGESHGLPMALYTDRASWAVYTSTSGSDPDRRRLTQVGRAL